jgi:RNA polymerase sigma factor (sigma-70 family)
MNGKQHVTSLASYPPAAGSDERLAVRAKSDPDAFAELYERYLDDVYRYCARRVNSMQAAEDLTATVFERALAGIERYRGGSFRAWIFRIAHNAVTDHYRRGWRLVTRDSDTSLPDADPTPEEIVIADERSAMLQDLLDSLTEDQRRVVELRLAGLTGTEIAELLSRSPDAVKMLQYRALQRLRTQIITLEPEDAGANDE